MRIVMVGLSHRTAGLDLREKVAVADAALPSLLDRVRAEGRGVEVAALSTCNRTEIYIARPTHEPPDAERLRHLLAEHAGVSFDVLASATIHREQDRAALHLFRVCGGLDSVVVGEVQILGQVKRAYEAAARRGCVGPVLHRLFQDALRAGKRMRRETGDRGASVGSAAADLARQVFHRFDDKTIVTIGAGEMVEQAVRHFPQTPAKLWLVNRTPGRAVALAERLGVSDPLGGARAYDDLDALLAEADVVLTCTSSLRPILTATRMKPIVQRRRRRPLYVLDLALPRDVDPAVGALPNVYLYNLDDLRGVIGAPGDARREVMEAIEHRLAEAVGRCMVAVQHRDVGHLIRQLRQRLHELGELETQRTLRRLAATGGDVELLRPIVAEHTRRLVNKFLHLPLTQVRRPAADATLSFYAAALRRLFDLEEAMEPSHPTASPAPAPAVD